MGSIAKTCLRSLLKVANSAMGIVGIMLILYSCWMIRVWQRDSSHVDYSSTGPWFMYTFLGIGVTMGVITCLGHIAADSAHGYCLSCYVVIISFLLLLETAMSADILLNSDWEKDLPEDPTGRFHDFEDFVKSNFDFCKWIGFMIILAQGNVMVQNYTNITNMQLGTHFYVPFMPACSKIFSLDLNAHVLHLQGFSILLAVALRTLGPSYYNYDSDGDYAPERLPLVNNKVQPPPYVKDPSDPRSAINYNTWNANK
ncbi:tetraspanin-19-like isoform X1 [Juglans microcarpa x Juglans regia]|uniref:tetraspanin-19-like isoform X1 n=1 Tax=Juglans microcarpa x Juglans regia TaxID=2249226 RepID=UPI001B7F5E3D|nr:tetraspanin-19-like isoform X1 [Juglans microcarpa x Juglans regia]